MKIYPFIVLLVFSSVLTCAQVSDNFSDGDFSNNPPWSTHAISNWVVSNNVLRSNSSTANSTFYLSTPSTQAVNAQWEFYVNLQFNTSSANFVDVYLTSSNAPMSAANGYFVRIGGTPDEISLYRSNAGTPSKLIDGVDGITNNSNTTLKIKVTRDAANLWTLSRDITGTGNDYFTEGTTPDNTFTTSSFFGIRITQSTSSFFNKHFFDDFYVGSIILDTEPPIPNPITQVSATTLNVSFNENIESLSSQTIANYSVNNGIGNPTSVVLQSDLRTVKLTFSRSFANGVQNQLTIAGIKDLASNVLNSTSLPFLYFIAVAETKNDLIVSEFLSDPDPIISLPAAEFIEIYNRSNNVFNLSGWKLTDGTSTATLPSQIILPDQYWILTASTNVGLFANYQNVLGIASFPSLNNSGDLILLKGSSGLTVDSLNYSLSWYRDADKQQGGWSLERINLNKSSIDPLNWIASQDATGGTPGNQNSWFGKNPDNQPPGLIELRVKNDSQLELAFDESLDQSSVQIANFLVNNGIGNPITAQLLNDQKTVLLSFSSKFQNGISNQLTLSNIVDIVGNKTTSIVSSFYYLIPVQAKSKDIVISEILPDPDPVIGLPSAEFVEIYNKSNNPFDLVGWKLTDGSSTATFSSQIILPNQYLIVTASTNTSLFGAFQNVIGIANFPSLNNSADQVALKNNSGQTIDSLNYALSWYRDVDKQQGGWSLEKIELNKLPTDQINWVASQDKKGGTPGKQNSWFGKNPDTSPPKLLNLVVKNDYQLELQFDEFLDAKSIVPSGFIVNNNVGNPTTAIVLSDQKSVSLSFNSKFENGYNYQLTISAIADAVGNKAEALVSSFFFLIPIEPKRNDVVITEFFPDPEPSIGLPEAEFIEIYNRSANPFDINGWKITDGSSTSVFGSQLILPQQYFIITATGNVAKFSAYPRVIGVANFPSLNNSGDLILIKSNTGLTLDSLNYDLNWYRDADKQQGGWSLEKIDVAKSSTDPINWVASQEKTGGTPGNQNSWFGKNPDVISPSLIKLAVKGESKVELVFDEPLDPNSIQLQNFEANNGLSIPSTLSYSTDSKVISLTFSSKFQNGLDNNLTISNITDLAGNKITPITQPFVFIVYTNSFYKDIIFTEIFPDPTPSLGLPEAEFIEVFNRSNNPFDLVGWTFQSGNSVAVLPNQIILPQQFLIITNTKNTIKFSSFSKVASMASFPILGNETGTLQLRNNKGTLIDSLSYNLDWYRNNDKAEGGYSLELIDPNNPCGEQDNWIASESETGGTPGKQNSVFANKPDLVGPKLVSVRPVDEMKLLLEFDEKLDSKSIASGIFLISPQIEILETNFSTPAKRQLLVTLKNEVEKRRLYSIALKSIYDCAGNLIQSDFSKLSFALPEEAEANDVLINELLFNPRPNGVDFVEFYNNSSKYISLDDLRLGNSKQGALESQPVSATGILLEPKQFKVFTSDPIALKNNYPTAEEKDFIKTSLPSLPDDDGSILILSKSGAVIDSFAYSKKFHSTFIKNDEGVSLERISFAQNTNDPVNWKSASSQSGFATPGYLNSNARLVVFALAEQIKVDPEVFVPNSGLFDFAKINYEFDQNNLVANIKILDQQGRLIKIIANNETLGLSGFFRWDGNLEDGSKAKMGYYVVWIDLFDESGFTNTIRKKVIVAGQ